MHNGYHKQQWLKEVGVHRNEELETERWLKWPSVRVSPIKGEGAYSRRDARASRRWVKPCHVTPYLICVPHIIARLIHLIDKMCRVLITPVMVTLRLSLVNYIF